MESYVPASLIQTESGGNWAAQNNETGSGGKRGHFGRVQFGHARLQEAMDAGVIPQGTTPEQFMANPDLQVAAENWHFADLRNQLADLEGRVVSGKPMTMQALIAMGHLGGAGGARRFVESGGKYNPSDSFGTSLADYAGTHGGNRVAVNSGGADAGQANNPPPVERNPLRLAWARRTGKMTPEDAAIYDRGVQAGVFGQKQPDPLETYQAVAQRPRRPLQTTQLQIAPATWPGLGR